MCAATARRASREGTLLPGEAAIVFILFGIALIAAEWFIPTSGVLGTGGAIAVVLGLSILVGQGTTELDLRSLLTLVGVGALAIVLLGGAAFVLLARGYMAGREPPGEARL